MPESVPLANASASSQSALTSGDHATQPKRTKLPRAFGFPINHTALLKHAHSQGKARPIKFSDECKLVFESSRAFVEPQLSPLRCRTCLVLPVEGDAKQKPLYIVAIAVEGGEQERRIPLPSQEEIEFAKAKTKSDKDARWFRLVR